MPWGRGVVTEADVECLLRRRQWEEAWDQSRRLDPGYRSWVRGRIHFEFGSFDDAKRLLKAATLPGSHRHVRWLPVLRWWAGQLADQVRCGDEGRPTRNQLIELRDRIGAIDADSIEYRIAAIRVLRRERSASEQSATDDDVLQALDELRTTVGQRDGDEVERLLGLATYDVETEYLALAFESERREYDNAGAHLDALDELLDGRQHAAAAVIRARVLRALGRSPKERRESAAADVAALKAEQFPGFSHSRFLGELLRQSALAIGVTDPFLALEQIEKADKHRDREMRRIGDAPSDAGGQTPPVRSYARLTYAALTGQEAPALDLAARLLRNRHLFHLASRVEDPDAPKRPALTELTGLAEIHTRAVLAVSGVLRAVGRHEEALLWLERLAKKKSVSQALVEARLLSLRSAVGVLPDKWWKKGRKRRPDESIDAIEAYRSEKARTHLGLGNLDEARALFERLTESGWHDTKIEGWVGLVDVARRERRLDCAQELYERACADVVPRARHVPPELWTALGWAEVQLGDARVGLAHLLNAAERMPLSISAWIGTVRALRVLGRTAEALTILRACALVERPETATRYSKIALPNLGLRHRTLLASETGWCLLDLDDFSGARAQFRIAVEAAPYFASGNRGLIASTLPDRSDDTAAAVTAAVENIPDGHYDPANLEREYHLEAGRVHCQRREFVEAESYFDLVDAEIDSDSPHGQPVRFSMAAALLDSGRLEHAERYIGMPWYDSDPLVCVGDDRRNLLKARQLLAVGEPKTCLEFLDRLSGTRAAPFGEALRIAHVTAAFEARDFKRAEELIDAAKAKSSNAHAVRPETPASDVLRLLAGWNYLAQSELPGAKAHKLVTCAYRQLRQTDGQSTDELHLAAVVLARRSTLEGLSIGRAAAAIKSAIARRPHDPSLQRDKAAILLQAGDDSAARDAMSRASTLDPNDARTHLLSGLLRHRRGDASGAVDAFRRAVALDPADFVHHRALALSHLETGDLDRARQTVDHGIAAGADRPERLHLLRARVVAAQAAEAEPRAARRMLTTEASRVRRQRQHFGVGIDSRTRSEFYSREAFLHARAGQLTRARGLLLLARHADHESPEAEQLRDQLPRRASVVRIIELAAVAIVFAFGAFGIWMMSRLTLDAVREERYGQLDAVALGAGTFVAITLAAALAPRIASITFRDVGLELVDKDPVEELVHIDLDLSANRIMLISGFSNNRPGVPLDDVESRQKDPPG